MRRAYSPFKLLPALFIGFFSMQSLAVAQQSPNTLQLRGTVLDGTGTPPLRADVHLGPMTEGEDQVSSDYTCSSDGSFSVPVSAPGLYLFRVSAVNHQELAMPLWIDASDFANGTVRFQVQLRPNPFPKRLSDYGTITILGDWNRQGPAPSDTLTRTTGANGKTIFQFMTKATGDSIQYELAGIAGSHTVNGTDADYYVYDGGGDYRSVLRSRTGQTVKITFDPSKLETLVNLDQELLPKIQIQNDGFLQQSVNIAVRAEAMRGAALTIPEGGGPMRMSAPKMQALLDTVDAEIRNAGSSGDTRLQQFSAVLLAKYYHPQLEFGPARVQRIMAAVPATSPLWQLAQNYVMEVIAVADSASRAAYTAALEQNPVPGVRAVAFAAEMEHAYHMRDTARWTALYDLLKKNYSNVREIEDALTTMNPNAKVQVGLPVPDFEVASLDGGQTISNKSMLGRYYMMDFWATWCGPCVGEMPALHKAYQRFKGRKGFEILSLSMDGDKAAISRFRKKWQMPWLHTFIPGIFNADVAKQFEVAGIPRPILIDPTGKIVAMEDALRGDDLEKTLAMYLGENP